MQQLKKSIIFVLMITLCVAILTPATPAYAFSLTDLLPQNNTVANTSSGNNVLNILLGLLLSKFLGNINSTAPSKADLNPVASLTPPDSKVKAIIATAQNYMGVPYVWGGETPDGFDCSGYTQYVMNKNGITIPRTAAEQFETGTAINKSNLRIGDLVFFTTYKPGASHVGFYIGDNKFMHASSVAAKVTVSALDDQYYTDHYIGARRYTQ